MTFDNYYNETIFYFLLDINYNIW